MTTELQRGGSRAPEAGGLAQPRPVRDRQGDHPGDEARGHRGPAGNRSQPAQDAVRIDAGRVHGEAEDRDRYEQADPAALGERLERHIHLPEDRQLPATHQDRVAAVSHQRVHDGHQDKQGNRKSQRRRDGALRAGSDARERDRDSGRGQDQRAGEDESDPYERAEIGDRGGRRGKMQRASAGPVGERGPHRTGTPMGPPPSAATAKWLLRSSPSSPAAARTPARSVPVTTQVGGPSAGRNAATRPAPRPSEPAGSPRSLRRVSSGRRTPAKLANTPLSLGGSSSRPASGFDRIRNQTPTKTAMAPSDRSLGPAPASEICAETRSHTDAAARQRRLAPPPSPSNPCANGSGHEPTTAGTRLAAGPSR